MVMKIKSLLAGLLVLVMVGVVWGQGIEKSDIPRNFTGLPAKTTLTGADIFVLNDSADANLAKKITITNLLTYLNGALSIANTTGNAATATKLATARAINGVDFDGTGPIEIRRFLDQTYFSSVVDNGTTHAPTYGTAENPTIDWTKGNIQKITSDSTGSATPTVAFTAPTGPCCLTLKITHEATTTAITYTWPATVKWQSGVKPTTTNTSGGVDVISFLYDGSAYYGLFGLDMR